jgi:hypothetical protein
MKYARQIVFFTVALSLLSAGDCIAQQMAQDGRLLRRYRRRWKIGVSSQGHINHRNPSIRLGRGCGAGMWVTDRSSCSAAAL